MKNSIVQEVREARKALAEKFDFDLHRICVDAMKRQVSGKSVKRGKGGNPCGEKTGSESSARKAKPRSDPKR